MDTRILAIETSCDETAASVVGWENSRLTVLSSVVATQVELHKEFGGVVPNLAAREHMAHIIPTIKNALWKEGVEPAHISAIAVTQGPGLIPALQVGVTAAKTLAYIWEKPLIGIHHLEGHIYANFIGKHASFQSEETSDTFPLLALVVSGGHTQLILMKDHLVYEILGETRDDAAGEAFDKAARLLGLSYPGGPAIEKQAKLHEQNGAWAMEKKFFFPRPMIDSDDFDFSFSGLKTAALYFLQKHEAERSDESFIRAVAYEFQEAIVDVLVEKTRRAIAKHEPKTFVIAGGVSANVRLRDELRRVIGTQFPGTLFLMPEFQYSLDNAAMIGAAALLRYEHMSDEEREKCKTNATSLEPDANLSLIS